MQNINDESKWTGDVESAFFESQRFEKYRVINLAEKGYSSKLAKGGYYIMGVDVGRFECTTEVVIIKVTPTARGSVVKQIVNIYTIEAENFIIQALKLKRLFNQYKCKAAVVDGNGVDNQLSLLVIIK